MRIVTVIGAAMAIFGAAANISNGAVAASAADPYLWLEEVQGKKALDWVRSQNERSLKVLHAHPSYPGNLAEVTKILTAKDRIPLGRITRGQVMNFWQDEKNQRGVWRRAPLAEYVKDNPQWEVLLDIDALNVKEKETWVFKGSDCLPPKFERCLITLSRGGGDASVVREFDLTTKTFVEGGFYLPEAKSDSTWLDVDTLIVGTDWGKGSLTESGYPRIVKLLKRGQKLEHASAVFEGTVKDVSVAGSADISPDGRVERFITRATDFFNQELYWADANWKTLRVPVPDHAQYWGLHKRQMLFTLQKVWARGSERFAQGSLISIALDAVVAGEKSPPVSTILAPDMATAIADVSMTADSVYLSLLTNVNGRIDAYTLANGNWHRSSVALPDNGTVGILSASEWDKEIMISYESFLTPNSVYLSDGKAAPRAIKTLPKRFDASGMSVKQHMAVSSDGENIPYFLVMRDDAKLDGGTPTLIYAYGGFQVSTVPWYWGSAGKLWLEQGGAYVIANIRGGGEFGPRWHEAVKGPAKRPLVFDDMTAVAKDLIARKVTSSRRMGIMGGSNGGLLVGAVTMRNPTLFNAVVCQVPLLDMLRYTELLAGASWAAEYGDPANASERALIETWSPYQNLTKGLAYPPILFTTSTKDDRVHPGHARKMAAKMEGFGMPFYYYENIEGGHSAAADLKQRAEQQALSYSYLRQQLMD